MVVPKSVDCLTDALGLKRNRGQADSRSKTLVHDLIVEKQILITIF